LVVVLKITAKTARVKINRHPSHHQASTRFEIPSGLPRAALLIIPSAPRSRVVHVFPIPLWTPQITHNIPNRPHTGPSDRHGSATPRAAMAVNPLDFSPPSYFPADDQMPSPPPSASSSTPPASIITTAGGGPLMGTHSVLPRPRPGRKPAADAPRTKRGEQNRAAQRNYRAREKQAKEELVRERDVLLAQIARERDEFAEVERARAQEREEWMARLQQAAAENDALRARVNEVEVEKGRALERVRSLEGEVGGLRAAVQGMSGVRWRAKLTTIGSRMQQQQQQAHMIMPMAPQHCNTGHHPTLGSNVLQSQRKRAPSNAKPPRQTLIPPIPIDFTGIVFDTFPPAPNGCGMCKEGGSCPCVDSLINHDNMMVMRESMV
jgi:hypothetical protein